MNPLARGYSFVMYLAESAVTYTIPFPYLHSEDIRVFAGDVGDAVEQSFKWIGPTEIQLADEVPAGILVTIRRFTPRDRNLVVVEDGTQLPARDLNLNSTQLLYIIQEQLDFGTYGAGGLPGGGSGWPGQGDQPSLPIQQIIDAIMQSPIMGILVTKLDDIDNTAETMLEELLRSDQTFDERRRLEGRIATAETSLTALVDDKQSVATQITELFAKFDSAAAQFIQVNQAIATETEARTTSATQLSAAIDDSLAQITDVKQAVANETEARSTAITKVAADFAAGDQAISQTMQTSYATKDYAQAIATTQVEAFSKGSFANLQQRFEALVVGSPDPGANPEWQANWSVKMNGGKIDGIPVIAGIGLGIDSKTGSTFTVMADRFAMVSPTYTTTGGVAQLKYPFVVGTVGGVSTVGIEGQLVVDGSITANKIRANSLSAITANLGEVNGGTFRTFQLDGNGAIINPLEFRCEMTNNPGDAYPMWIGAGVKNWNNAVFSVDRSGNAKFAGQITAQNMIGNLQKSTYTTWNGDIQANIGGVGPQITLTTPVLLGEYQVPVLHVECEIHNPGSNPCTGLIILEKLVGSTWVVMKQHAYYMNVSSTAYDSMMALDGAATSGVTYRVRIDGTGQIRPDYFHVTSISIYALGLR